MIPILYTILMQPRLRRSEEGPGEKQVIFPSVLIGAFAGVASGLLGVGGGIVMVPLLTIFVGFNQHRAHATSLAAIIPIAAAGATRFAIGDSIDYGLGALLALGAIMGPPSALA